MRSLTPARAVGARSAGTFSILRSLCLGPFFLLGHSLDLARLATLVPMLPGGAPVGGALFALLLGALLASPPGGALPTALAAVWANTNVPFASYTHLDGCAVPPL